jgi:flagellar basal body P-ring formation protein FlgA
VASVKSAVLFAQTFAACAAVAAAPADARFTPTPELLQRAATLARDAAASLAPPLARIDVQPGALDSRLQLAPCAQVQAYLPAGASAWGRTRVGLRCTDGAARWNVFLPVLVQVWAPAVVVQAELPAGARLQAAQLSTAIVDWAAAGAAPLPLPAAAIGRTLARPVAAGQALRSTDLQSRQWFAAGDTVQVLAQGDGFSVATEAQALSPGLEGQPARVRTEGGRVLSGQPVGDKRIEVRL